uniref:Uncharacterized protein n=1 Tax=viral metagenome TaxID=1070528 RepID=A0A6C0D439_9ZZZZ
MTSCFSLISNYTSISNNRYILNNNYITNISFGLFNNSNNNYLIRGVPYNYPLTFFSRQSNDISNIISFEALNTEPIVIYVSRGQDISFINGDFFRFYDTSYQLLNINHGYRTIYDSSLTDVRSNFYFMNSRSYTFKTTTDFCSNFPFTISGNLLTSNYNLQTPNTSFTLTIPANADNSNNKLFYRDNDLDISGNLYILRDVSGLNYYYGDISFSIKNYTESSNINLSIKSYDFSYGASAGRFGNKEISNNNLFYYSSSCSYIISNNLPNNNEFLNNVSALDLSSINGVYKFSFNKNNHSTYTNNNPTTIYNLNFGLGKGSYIIIDVSSAFPMRLNNDDISNCIAIDTTYQPSRLRKVEHNTKSYYHGSFKIKVFDDFSNVNIALLNRTSLQEVSYNSKFFYTELPHLQGGSYRPSGTSYLKLMNQQYNYYDLSESLHTSNIYELNLDSSYKELSYIAADKYGHNLNIQDFITTIPSSEETINQEISNNILSGLFTYNIYYKVIDYENTSIENIRKINVNSGPVIEISSNYLQNNNIYSNILQFQNNTFNPNYNFFDNIKVYIFDTSRQKINIPFEVTISGYYFNNNDARTIIPLTNNTSFSYTQQQGSATNTEYLRISQKNYYAYYRSVLLFRNSGNDTIRILNNNQTPLIYDNSRSPIFNDQRNKLDKININETTNEITIGSSTNSIKLDSIEQNLDISTISLNFNLKYQRPNINEDFSLNCSLKVNNYFFEISFNSPIWPEDNCKVSGRFNPKNFFTTDASNLIDISYIGSYNLTISTKGLSGGDYFYDTSLIRNRFFNQNIKNGSRTYTINIIDTTSPVLKFYDKNTLNYSTTTLYSFPRARTFNILQDICFVTLRTISNYNSYVSNKPLIQYSDDSIYDLSYIRDISFTLLRLGTGTNINYNSSTKELSLNVITIDSSCIINYRAKDIYNNWSQDISLILSFVAIPYVELSGNAIIFIDFSRNSTSYRDAGLKVYSISNPLITTPFIPNIIPGNGIFESSRNVLLGPTIYDISYNSDICLNNVNATDYSFNYIISISGSNIPLRLTRRIRVVDTKPPFFLFPNFASINYILNDSRLATYDTNYTSSNRSIHSRDTSFNIDFSFVAYRSFADLSKVLYDFDVSDNYAQKPNITRTLRYNNNPGLFTFNDISNYFDNSINRILNSVTISKSLNLKLPQLLFNYDISDSNNSYSVIRKVDIINLRIPVIDFSFVNYYPASSYSTSYNYVYFGASFKDFSYVALDYSKPNSSYNFIQELSSILFNFDLSNNVNSKANISYQITISNNSYRQSILTINDLSNNNTIKSLFSIRDTSFSLIYDISDNQDNSYQTLRNVRIIDVSTSLDISFLNNSSLLTISFGDTNVNILRDVSFNHKRLTTTSISFDISYNFQANTTTSVSGGTSLFDPSALIYRLGDNSVNYFPSAYSSSFYSRTRTIRVINNPPLISFPSAGISHEIYTPLSDASLIFGVTSYSIYDDFFFKNYRRDLSYNGTNYKITFDNCLNIMEPSAGTYNIYYSSTDLYNTTSNRTRILDVADRTPPLITICGDFYYTLSGNTYNIAENSYYIEYGAYAYDQGTRTSFANSNINIRSQRNNITNSTLSYENITTQMLQNTLLYKDSSYNYRIIYEVQDRFANVQTLTRNIAIIASNKPKLYPYIEVSTSNGILEYKLTENIYINTKLINTTNIGSPFYDLSLSFKYETDSTIANNQNIICEAVKSGIFRKGGTNNCVKFKLRATDANNIPLETSFVNVEYENIDSLNISKTYKIYFYARDISQAPIDQISFLEYNLKFVDTTPPQVTLLSNRNFQSNSNSNSNSNLKYPLLSATSISALLINIASYANFNNLYNNYENYYKKSITNNIVLLDPGINISDIVSGEVNYIDNSFQTISGGYNFTSSNISISYNIINGSIIGSAIDVCNILFDGCANNFVRNYRQNYIVSDNQGNIAEQRFRTISVERFPPFINLNYQKDSRGNNYITYYHKKFEKYVELGGRVLDYYDGFTLSFENVNTINAVNENINGAYTINYDISNSNNIYSNTQRKVNVITSLPLVQNNSYNFSELLNFNFPTLTNKTYTKYSLYNGTYKFDVSHNLAFNIITQEFDICNGLYIISNVVSIVSDTSYTINAKNYYCNNVTLTVSGDFNRLSIELSNNASYSNIFVYDSKNIYTDLYDVIDNNENNVVIDSSYVVDISNLNNPNSRPNFTIDNTSGRDLHLSIGNYRFYQYGFKNFHNPIKFSITKDGTHNGGVEYTKNIFRRNLPGVSIINKNSNSSYTQLNIDATTPALLYYYCENFPNMGGQIVIKNNIIFSKQTIILNNYVIDAICEDKILNTNYLVTNNITGDVLKNRVLLTQRFNVSGGGDTSFVNITCITQQNIQHNMLYNIKQQPHKLIIRKHTNLELRPDVSFTVNDYSLTSIMRNNTNKYLVEYRGTGYNFSNTYINLFKYDFDSSLNVIKREANPALNIYEEDIRTLFYNHKNFNFYKVGSQQLLDEIINYIDFFKSNKLLTKTLLADSFKYKISNFFYGKPPSKVLNLDNANEYNYNEKLLAPRIRVTNITGNYVTFTLDIYYNNNNNWYLSNDILSTNKEVLFGTYEYIVYSDSFTEFSNVVNAPALRDFITFYNGSLTITSNIIYSYKPELSNNFYDYRIFNKLGYNELSNNELSNNNLSANISDLTNIVFLSIKDTSNNKESLCGLTKQNLYNNVYFDENQTLIFHKFSPTTIVNYQVNSPALTLETTLNESTNSDNYLLDIADNDIYNFYNERPLNLNTLRDLSSNEEYNVYISYTINDELANTNNYLTQFDIQPIYLNNMPIRKTGNIYRQYSEIFLNSYDTSINTITELSYNSIDNKLSSHSYIIDLNDYFDINIFKNSLRASNLYLTDYIDVTKLNYKLLDISFTIPFNLYDLAASQIVVFNATNLNVLLSMRNKIIPLYYKLTYMIKIFEISFPNVQNQNQNQNQNSTLELVFKDNDNINYYINLLRPDPSDSITNFYTNEVSVAMLNRLQQEIFDNIQILLFTFNDTINNYNIRHSYLVNITNFLNMVLDFNYTNIEYLDNTLMLLEYNVENILTNMSLYFGENNIIALLNLYNLNNLTSNIVLANGNVLTNNDVSYLDYCFKAFYTLNNDLDLMRKEVEVRNYNYLVIFQSYKYMIASNNSNNLQIRYRNLHTSVNSDPTQLYSDLYYNFNLLNANFILDYSYVLYNYANVTYYSSPFPKGTNNIVGFQAYNSASIVNYETLYTNVNNLYNIITSVFNIVSSDYNITNKPTLYVNSSYEFTGSKLLINSYYSNSITVKLNIQYKKSLYQTIDLSNIYLDITIPDLTPPTVIFNNTSDICFNEKIFKTDALVNTLVNTELIKDLSYIDLNQSYTITFADRKYFDTNAETYVLKTLSYSNNSLSLLQIDFTDISNVTFNDNSVMYTYIKYILLDNANNRNVIKRKILLENDNSEPIFFYKAQTNTWRAYGSSSTISETQRPTLIINQSITQPAFVEILTSSIKIVDPILHERTPNLLGIGTVYSDISLTRLLTDASSIDLSYITIENINGTIQTILIYNNNTGQAISNFNNLINNQLLTESNNNSLFIKYVSSKNVYPRSGQLTIRLQITPTIITPEAITDIHCCYPKVEYKPIQDNYKLGSQNTTVMRMAKFLINRHI